MPSAAVRFSAWGAVVSIILAIAAYFAALGSDHAATNGDELLYAQIARVTAKSGALPPAANRPSSSNGTPSPPRLRLSSHSALPVAIDASAVTLLEPTRKDSKLPVLKKPRGKFFDADSLGAPIPSGMSQSKSTQHHAILFLDIDGVLNTTSTMLAHPGALRFAPSAVAALKEILSATDCRIVLTSTRRRNGLEPIRQAFLANGLPEGAERLIDSTPILSDSDTDSLRAEEIQSWLEENHFTGPFAILDDGPIYGLPVITTSHDLGLTLRDADRAIQRLG